MDQVKLETGDWVLSADTVLDGFLPEGLPEVVAEPGAVGHVLEVTAWGINVFFERTGIVTICHRDELQFLCRADGEQPK
jgi:hypothetical protein